MSYNRNNILLKIWNDNAFDVAYSKCLEFLSHNKSKKLENWAENLFTVAHVKTDREDHFNYRSARKNAQLLFNLDVSVLSFTQNLPAHIKKDIETIMAVVSSKVCASLLTVEDSHGNLIDLLLLPMISQSGRVILGQITCNVDHIGKVTKIHSMQYIWKNEHNPVEVNKKDSNVIFLRKNRLSQVTHFGRKN